MKNKSMLRVLALVVVLSMIFTTAVFAMAPDFMAPGQLKKLERNLENYEEAAKYMKEKGYIKGYGDNEFGFTDLVKRGDIAVMIARSFKLSLIINSLDKDEDERLFGDVDSKDYFYDAIFAAKKLGIAKGDGKNFNPNKYVTVEEAILMIERSVAAANDNVMEGFEEVYDEFDLEEISKNLRDMYDDEMDDFATRQDIALMLYYVLMGDEYDLEDNADEDLDDMDYVVYTIDEDGDQFVEFDDKNFKDVFNDLDLQVDEELEYVRFFLPVKNGTLYYEYNEDDNEHENELVRENEDYYVGSDTDTDLIDEITFVPKDEFSGTVYIRFLATSDEDNTFYGLVKIIVEGVEEEEEFETLTLIEYDAIDENTEKEFDEDDLDSDMVEVKFAKPGKDEGTLYFDIDDNLKVNPKVFYAAEKFDQVTFVPAQDFTGKVNIEYTAKDADGNDYSGTIMITVEEVQEIETMDGDDFNVNEDEDLTIYFEDELDDLTNEDNIFTQNVYNSVDYVTFEHQSEGEFEIDMDVDGDGYGDGYKDVKAGTKYDIDKIIELKYVPVHDSDSDDESVEINFTAFVESNNDDIDDKEYNGVIEITVFD
jgi:hypothetical protein